MELVIVERVYDEPLSDEHAEELRRKAGPCFRMRRVKHLKMYLSKDRLRAICLYEAPDAATVREAHEQEGFAYAKIWSASTYCSPDAEET
jgi:hypothetical protein